MTQSEDIFLKKFAVSHADITLLHFPGESPVVIDTSYIKNIEDIYSRDTVEDSLAPESIQHCFLTHFDDDHVSGLAELLVEAEVQTLSYPPAIAVAHVASDDVGLDVPDIDSSSSDPIDQLIQDIEDQDPSILEKESVAKNYRLVEVLQQQQESPADVDPSDYSQRVEHLLRNSYDIDVDPVTASNKFTFLGGDVVVDVLWPPADVLSEDEPSETWTINELSNVFRVETPHQTHLFTGDISGRVESELCAQSRMSELDLAADVVHASHHGATENPDRSSDRIVGNSERFLSHVDPDLLLISSDRSDKHDHPDPQIFDRCLDQDIEVLWTAVHGDIEFRKDGIYTGKNVTHPAILKEIRTSDY